MIFTHDPGMKADGPYMKRYLDKLGFETFGPYHDRGAIYAEEKICALVERLRKGDTVWLQFSCHGDSNYSAKLEDHHLKMGNILWLDTHPTRGISSTFLTDEFARRIPHGVTAFVVADACHSGSMVRLPYVYNEFDVTVQHVNGRDTIHTFKAFATNETLDGVGWDPRNARSRAVFAPEPTKHCNCRDGCRGHGHVVYLSSSSDGQESYVQLVEENDRGQFGWVVAAVTEVLKFNMTFHELIREVREHIMRNRKYAKHDQMDKDGQRAQLSSNGRLDDLRVEDIIGRGPRRRRGRGA